VIELINILKNIADQYFYTSDKSSGIYNRKYTISDLRSIKKSIYSRIKQLQNNRCSGCGAEFSGKILETLDHIIPWRIGGDPTDGSNWQILCEKCNRGKGTMMSVLLSLDFYNWIYGDKLEVLSGRRISDELRYITLVRNKFCSELSCQANPSNRRLYVVPKYSDGLSIVDMLDIKCELHAAGDEKH
jgi:hypothetical protein